MKEISEEAALRIVAYYKRYPPSKKQCPCMMCLINRWEKSLVPLPPDEERRLTEFLLKYFRAQEEIIGPERQIHFEWGEEEGTSDRR